jgi:hypothetical protein
MRCFCHLCGLWASKWSGHGSLDLEKAPYILPTRPDRGKTVVMLAKTSCIFRLMSALQRPPVKYVCSLSEQLSEVVTEDHEGYSLAQRLAIKHEGLEQELPVIDLVIPCIENTQVKNGIEESGCAQ